MRAEFLIVSDLHVDEYDRFSKIISSDEYGPINSRLFWCLDIFDQIREYGEKVGCKTLLLGGDIFDKRGSISVRSYNEVFYKISRLVNEGWEIFSIVGNHDQALKSTEIHALECFPIQFAQTRAIWESREGFKVGGIAYHEQSGDFYRELVELAKEEPDLYLIHQGIHGALIAGDEILSREDVRLEDVRRFVGSDAWVLSGHYHIHQQVDPKFYFVGSATPKDFGDKTDKGFLHFKNGHIQQVVSRAPKFLTIDAEQLEAAGDELDGHYVQIRYEGNAPQIMLPKSESLLLIPRKVEREYQSRVDISADNSPRKVFASYLNSFNFEEAKLGKLEMALGDVVGNYRFSEKMGSARVNFTRIEYQNFLRFGTLTSVDFEKHSGLTLIEGENQDDPSSISNGAGKSSIFEGLRWVLFGSTLRGLASDEVVNSQVGKDCMVGVWFEVDGKSYLLQRYRKHRTLKNSVHLLTYNDKGQWEAINTKSDKDTTELVSRLIGADERVFDSIVFLGYGFGNSFAGLTDKEQKQILENILGISYLSELLERARDRAGAAKGACTEHNIKISYVERQLEEKKVYLKGLLQRRETSLREDRQKLEREIAEKSDLIGIADSIQEDTSIRQVKEELKALAIQKSELAESLKGHAEVKAELDDLSRDLKHQLNSTARDISNEYASIQSYSRSIEKAMREIKSFEASKEAGICPTCEQPLGSHEAVAKKLEELHSGLLSFQRETKKSSKAIEKFKAEQETQMEAIKEVENALETTREVFQEMKNLELQEARKKLFLSEEEANFGRIIATAKAARASVEKASEALKNIERNNPYAELTAETEESVKKLEAELTARTAEREADLENLELFKFWETAFSDKGSPTQPPIKSFILESVVPVLDEFARRYSETLSSGAIEVRFNTVSRLKSGEMREQFGVEVANRYGSADYRGDSGGERRKVDIAIMFALHALSRLQTGTFFNVVCLDEVLDSLDKEGCDRVAELLRELTKEIEKIFVITHNENLVSKFGSKLKVIKKDGYSEILDYTPMHY